VTTPHPLPSPPAHPPTHRGRIVLEVLLILGATLLAYQPAWRAGFIWDDDAHLTRPALQSVRGLGRIWSEPGATQQYYPVLYSAFWLEHRLWGGAAAGYHFLNLILHAGAAGLFLRLLRRLAVPGALFAALLFALHPVMAESVAWISEEKNTLSALFYFLAALAYLRFDRTRARAAYALGLGCFVLALLSKSVTATLPAALLVIFWWRRGRLRLAGDVLPLVPWLGLGLGAGILTAWMERVHVGAQGPAFAYGLGARLIIAGHALLFYLGKLLWPANLTFIYPRWDPASFSPWAWIYPAFAAAALAACWSVRRRSRGPLAVALLFAGTLLPALGFINVFPFLYSFVADHFQYVSAAAIFAAAGAAAAVLTNRWAPAARAASGALLLAVLGTLTWRQCRQYADAETLWRTTLARNPSSWMADNNLAGELLRQGRTAEAEADVLQGLALAPENAAAHATLGQARAAEGRWRDAAAEYRRALELEPANAPAQANYGGVLLQLGRLDEAADHYRAALALEPDSAPAHTGLGNALLRQGEPDRAAAEYRLALADDPTDVSARTNLGAALMQLGQPQQALAEFSAAVAANPQFGAAQVNLANALLQCGHVADAVSHYEAALALEPRSSVVHGNLGVALLQAGRREEAARELQRALELDPANAGARAALESLRSR